MCKISDKIRKFAKNSSYRVKQPIKTTNPLPEMKGITVYCASSDDIADEYFEAAKNLGKAIALRGLPLINGGGRMGLMRACSDGALSAGGTAIGVIPRFMAEAGRAYDGLTQTIVTADMHERKRTLAELALGVIALPGGVGTLEEITEMMTARKLGLYDGKVVILNIAGFYDKLISFLDKTVRQGFSYGPPSWDVAHTPEEALSIILD